MNGRLQVALLLAALFGGYAVIGMVDADEAVRDGANVSQAHICACQPDEAVRDAAQMRACTPKNDGQCAAARKQSEVKNVRRPRIFRA